MLINLLTTSIFLFYFFYIHQALLLFFIIKQISILMFVFYEWPDVMPFKHTLICVKPKNLCKTALNFTHMLTCEETLLELPRNLWGEWDLRWLWTSYFGFILMGLCMKSVTSGPL